MGYRRGKIWPAASVWIKGREYQWSGWFGCQLFSYEWKRPPAGSRRDICLGVDENYTLTVFRTKRRGLKIEIAWTITLRGNIDEKNAQLREFQKTLRGIF